MKKLFVFLAALFFTAAGVQAQMPGPGAQLPGGPGAQIPNISASGGSSVDPSAIQRGMAQGMRDALSISGGSNRGVLAHTHHFSPTQSFSRSKVVFALTYQAGTQLQDTDLPNPVYFQAAIEPTFLGGTSGLSAPSQRSIYKFTNAKYYTYGGPGSGKYLIESDWLYHPTVTAGSGTPFGLWTYNENVSVNGQNIYSDLGSSFLNRGECLVNYASGNSQIANDPVLNVTTCSALDSTQIGGSNILTPAFLVIDYAPGVKAVSADGDSIAQYVGEGYSGSGSAGDSLGSLLRNAGYPQRGIVETLGLSPAINMARASDGTKFKSGVGAMKGRLARLSRANPTNHFFEDNINDLSGVGNVTGNIASWAANTFWQYGDLRLNGGNAYMVIRGGQGAAAGGPSGTGTNIADGQALWKYLGAGISTDRQYSVYARTAQVSQAYRTAAPGVKIAKAFTTPQASASSDSWLTTGGQTSSWPPPSIRSTLIQLYLNDIAASDTTIGDTWFQPGASLVGGLTVEFGYTGTAASASSIWQAPNTTTNYCTSDGTHPNSTCHAAIATGFTAPLFNFLLKRDIDPASNDNTPMWLNQAA